MIFRLLPQAPQDEENYSEEMTSFADKLTNNLRVEKLIYVEFNADAGQSIWLYKAGKEPTILFNENDDDPFLTAGLAGQIDDIKNS